jgi:N-acylglucosamine 2-epimerase
MNKEQVQQLHQFYRKHLLDDLVPFWESRTRDAEYGGYFHHFDRQGQPGSRDKNMWVQGRQLQFFSDLYLQLEQRPQWLDLARSGRDFIVKHGYAGDGRWVYLLNQDGSVKDNHLSFFTDAFILAGLCAYAVASQSDQDKKLIETTYDCFEKHFYDESFSEHHHFRLDPNYKWHGNHMIALYVSVLAEPVLGPARTKPMVDYCLDQILHVFAQNEHRVLFEAVGQDGHFKDDPTGRMINPGHIFESMWFCMEEGVRRNDQAVIDRSGEVISWVYPISIDKDYGGLYNILDCSGSKPVDYENQKGFGELWDDKVWWAHSETLYALLLAAFETENNEYFQWFTDLHEWSFKHFSDAEYGEWYAYLNRDGSVRMGDKGNWIKSAFHIPRDMLKIIRLLERILSSKTTG